jgi:hypothetical protein
MSNGSAIVILIDHVAGVGPRAPDTHGVQAEAARRGTLDLSLDSSGRLEDAADLALETPLVSPGACLERGNHGIVDIPHMECRHTVMLSQS